MPEQKSDSIRRSPKTKFHKKIKDVELKDEAGNKLWFNNHWTFDERMPDKTLGRVKHQIAESKYIEFSDTKMIWNPGVIKVQGT